MAPRKPAASQASQATQAARSRSPKRPARRTPYGKSFMPQVKDWVLTKMGRHYWADAVPALVTRVTVGLEDKDATVDLVRPNRLSLVHGFGGKGYHEMEGVQLSQIRPFEGDATELRMALLKAVRDYRQRTKMAKAPAAEDAEEEEEDEEEEEEQEQQQKLEEEKKRAEPLLEEDPKQEIAQAEVALDVPEARAMQVDQAEQEEQETDDQQQEEAAASGATTEQTVPTEDASEGEETSSVVPAEAEPEADEAAVQATSAAMEVEAAATAEAAAVPEAEAAPTTETAVPAAAAAATSPTMAPLAEKDSEKRMGPVEMDISGSPAPKTPEATTGFQTPIAKSDPELTTPRANRTLTRQETSEKAVPQPQLTAVEIHPSKPMDKKRFREFTKCVAQRFKATGRDDGATLTVGELSKSILQAGFGQGEFDSGLKRLDDLGKVFHTGDIVISMA